MYSTMDKQTSSSNNLKMTTSSTVTGECAAQKRAGLSLAQLADSQKCIGCERELPCRRPSSYDVIAPSTALISGRSD